MVLESRGLLIIAIVIIAAAGFYFAYTSATSTPPPPNVKFQHFEPREMTLGVGTKQTLNFNAVNNDAKSYPNIEVRLGSQNSDTDRYMNYDKNPIRLEGLNATPDATTGYSRDITARDGVTGNELNFVITAKLYVDGIESDKQDVKVKILSK
jgi:hypothetical protein